MFNFLQIAKLLSALGVSKGETLYSYARSQIGQKKSGLKAPIEYGCAEALNRIYKECFGQEIGGDVSTSRLYQALLTSYRFTRVTTPLKGDIIISPTGYGSGAIPSGHTGIISDGIKIMSNNSENGIWDEHLDMSTWINRYGVQGGFPIAYFRAIL